MYVALPLTFGLLYTRTVYNLVIERFLYGIHL